MKNFKVDKELFVAIRKNDAVGWAVPYSDTEKGKKDQDKVKQWATQYNQPSCLSKIITNEPIEGFEIDKSISRYSTSNKLWRIKDPRGFILEVSTENMEMLLENCTVEKGVVKEKCVWAFRNKMALIPETYPDFVNLLNEVTVKPNYIAPSKLKSGMILKKNTGEKIKYLGKAFKYPVKRGNRLSSIRNRWGGYEYEWYITDVDKKPDVVHLYDVISDGDGTTRSSIHYLKTIKATLLEEGKSEEITQDILSNARSTSYYETYCSFLTKEKIVFTHNDRQVFDSNGKVIYDIKKPTKWTVG